MIYISKLHRLYAVLIITTAAVSALSLAVDKPQCSASQKAPAAAQSDTAENQMPPQTLDGVLDRLRDRTEKLKSYEAELHYLFVQDPELLDSRRLQKGKIYYKETSDGSNLKIIFNTVKQDDAPVENRKEELFFDGVWLTRVDYSNETVNRYQQVEEDKPVNAFEYVSQNFPMVGFSNASDLRKQFDIELIDPAGDPNTTHMQLKVKEGSVYQDDYKLIDVWIDNKLFLPQRIRSVSVEDDIYDIKLLNPRVNKKIQNSIFTIEYPSNFSKNSEPLIKTRPQGGQ